MYRRHVCSIFAVMISRVRSADNTFIIGSSKEKVMKHWPQVRKLQHILIILSLLMIHLAATTQNTDFRKYWYQGKGELTRYSLEQARYGEIHKGESVLIFVTEPFLSDKQVKLESGKSPSALSVLKLNLTRKFFTGIYPYSMMTSIFTPVDFQKHRTLKVTSSTQEWCGQTYTQLNFKNNAYQAQLHSYFQAEADQNLQLKGTWLEDELWTRIRLAPQTLPQGEIEIVPALQFVRLGHVPLKVEKAVAQMKVEGKSQVYALQYKNLKRSLIIRFDSSFPHMIQSWEEKSPGGFGADAPILTTKAVKTHSILLDYWNKNNVADAPYRERLGLTQQ